MACRLRPSTAWDGRQLPSLEVDAEGLTTSLMLPQQAKSCTSEGANAVVCLSGCLISDSLLQSDVEFGLTHGMTAPST